MPDKQRPSGMTCWFQCKVPPKENWVYEWWWWCEGGMRWVAWQACMEVKPIGEDLGAWGSGMKGGDNLGGGDTWKGWGVVVM